MIKTCPMPPVCRDVLDPDFAKKNEPAGYDPTYNYVGSDYLKQKFGIALKREFCGTDLNPAAFLHDVDFRDGKGFWDFVKANREFRRNIAKLIAAPPKPNTWAAWLIAWFHWIGVSNVLALINYWTCK